MVVRTLLISALRGQRQGCLCEISMADHSMFQARQGLAVRACLRKSRQQQNHRITNKTQTPKNNKRKTNPENPMRRNMNVPHTERQKAKLHSPIDHPPFFFRKIKFRTSVFLSPVIRDKAWLTYFRKIQRLAWSLRAL